MQSTNKRSSRGKIGVGVNNGFLRFNIPATIHPTGKSKRIGIGLEDNRENRIKAENAAIALNTKVAAGVEID